jgi:hypothetical protein
MTTLPPAHAEDALDHLAQQFAQWRASRTTPRGRIPKPLWAQAVALTQVLPLAVVAKRLGLGPQALKKRGGSKPAVARLTTLPASLNFVEVAASPVWRPSTTEVEVHRVDGACLRLTYGEANSALAPLLQTFLESR